MIDNRDWYGLPYPVIDYQIHTQRDFIPLVASSESIVSFQIFWCYNFFCIMRRYLNSLLLLCNALILPTGTRKRFYIHVYATTFFDIVAKTMVLATKLNHSIFILTMNNFGLVYIIFSLIFNKFPNICNPCFHLFKFHLCIRLMFVNFESMLEVFHKAGAIVCTFYEMDDISNHSFVHSRNWEAMQPKMWCIWF